MLTYYIIINYNWFFELTIYRYNIGVCLRVHILYYCVFIAYIMLCERKI